MLKIIKFFRILASIVGGWLSLMSGATSIPLAFFALFSSGTNPKWWFALLAIIALWICIIRMAYKNYPKFKLSCSKEITACAVPNQANSMKYFRMVVETNCVNGIENCKGHLLKVEKDGVIIYDHDPRELPFAPAETDDCLAKTIYPNIPEHLDVLCIINPVHAVCFAMKGQPCGALNHKREYIFEENGEYILHVSVTGKGVPTAQAKLKFDWKGQWFTATMEKINES